MTGVEALEAGRRAYELLLLRPARLNHDANET
jgi:hypothetical protein